MQSFLNLQLRGVAKVSGHGVGWEGLGERWCEDANLGATPHEWNFAKNNMWVVQTFGTYLDKLRHQPVH